MDTAPYRRRVVDQELDELLPALPALCLEGIKGVGKTTSARARARTIRQLDAPDVRELLGAEPERTVSGDLPVLLDEWTEWPRAWDLVRHAVDDGAVPGSFLLTGSATPTARIHSGAGRIIPLRMRPMTLPERGVTKATVSLGDLLAGTRTVGGDTDLSLDDLIGLICHSGLPGAPKAGGWRATQVFLDGYLDRLFDHEVEEVGSGRRQSVLIRQWAAAYAAASATTATYEKLRDAASPGEAEKPARKTAAGYRELLTRLWFLDPVEAWLPTGTPLSRLGQAPKHFLADPAFAARLLHLTPDRLRGEAERHATVIGQLWESLAAMSVRVFAQPHMADVRHLRTQGGEHEVDLIVEGDDGILAAEVKLQAPVEAREVRHLLWLRERLGKDRIASLAVITAGRHAYTRPDGIHVVPLALLGP
ncbi:AAA family ATPase [Acidipropionibacterium acidipropionici ATCC 4875]|uniref:AAA family ATPase n=1 Tax=Acidipropionibacterium acidipropionici (strain ATCC 4875 / DSM 20272 / JCM 6432 / NBRC 12425 / NCIMB 8070 / 4) TaxID=1171373 RepID=K7SFX6_ACIA4|nr:DUF4143 domain-containing protein [Acidipropionibacterium acidipropionici]AFV88185.1 AAA family ATPase [Acidipropionibacterium acidipropionici ATCC 4875]